jgi:transcriptional regulator GlxA family with amidase domain
MNVALLIFEGVDVLDVAGPYEVFLTANRLAIRSGAEAPFEVHIHSVDGAQRLAYGGLGLVPTGPPLSELPVVDLLIVPGLIDVDSALADSELVTAIRAAATRATFVASVCTGAFLLAAADVLDDVVVTTHFEDVEELGRRLGAGRVQHQRWIDTGDIITSGGVSSGIDMALHLVERFASAELAQRTARQLEYRWVRDEGLAVAGSHSS